MSDLVVNVVRVGFVAALYVFLFFVARAVGRHLAGRPRAMSRPPEPPYVSLIVGVGAKDPRIVEIRRTMVVGRSPEADVTLDDEFASGLHARFAVVEGTPYVEDLGSRNGTLLNRRPVLERAALALGDVVRIGHTDIEVR
jgi:hypothetical protein